jgi:hypothetical protein
MIPPASSTSFMLLYFRDSKLNLLIHYCTWLEKCIFLCLGQVQVRRQLSLYSVSIYLSSLTIFNQSFLPSLDLPGDFSLHFPSSLSFPLGSSGSPP